MSSTNAALDWLMSLSATFTSSPIPNSDSNDFTDWLQASPTSSMLLSSSPPLQNITYSSRINLPQEIQDLDLNYFYDISGTYGSGISSASGSQSSLNVGDQGYYDGLIPTSVQPAMFNEHHRMASLASSTTTLVNTPSPRSRSYMAGPSRQEQSGSPFISSLLRSPVKFMEDIQRAPFAPYYADMVLNSPQAQATADVSPVVRAAARSLSDDRLIATRSRLKSKGKRIRRTKTKEAPASFAQKLQATEPRLDHQTSTTDSPTQLDSPLLFQQPSTTPLESVLLSPCRLDAGQTLSISENAPPLHTLPALTLEDPPGPVRSKTPLTPEQTLPSFEALSPLTPLSSRSSSPEPRPRLTIIINRKRALVNADVEASPSIRRSKRARKARAPVDSPSPSPPRDRSPSPSTTSAPQDPSADDEPGVYTTRTLPPSIEISEKFPLFYRRFPLSSYYQHGDAVSPCTLFKMPHPGGNYNTPRSVFDLYTPRFVKGRGVEKVGLCPICIEAVKRGGEKKKLWLAMKFSAFKCFWNEGISASTGRPFSPPTAFRVVPRVNPGKKEKVEIQQGKCHKCRKWVAVEGIKDMESKVKELYWWKHAAACHQESSLEGEGDYFENDDVLKTLRALARKKPSKSKGDAGSS